MHLSPGVFMTGREGEGKCCEELKSLRSEVEGSHIPADARRPWTGGSRRPDISTSSTPASDSSVPEKEKATLTKQSGILLVMLGLKRFSVRPYLGILRKKEDFITRRHWNSSNEKLNERERERAREKTREIKTTRQRKYSLTKTERARELEKARKVRERREREM